MTKTQKISNILKEMGIPASLLGYGYLRYAIDISMNDFSNVLYMTYKLYPEVAKKFGVTASRVERAMRHSIEVAWERGNYDLQCKLFGYSIDPKRGRPTNAEFIGTICDYLLMAEEQEDVHGS